MSSQFVSLFVFCILAITATQHAEASWVWVTESEGDITIEEPYGSDATFVDLTENNGLLTVTGLSGTELKLVIDPENVVDIGSTASFEFPSDDIHVRQRHTNSTLSVQYVHSANDDLRIMARNVTIYNCIFEGTWHADVAIQTGGFGPLVVDSVVCVARRSLTVYDAKKVNMVASFAHHRMTVIGTGNSDDLILFGVYPYSNRNPHLTVLMEGGNDGLVLEECNTRSEVFDGGDGWDTIYEGDFNSFNLFSNMPGVEDVKELK